MPGALSAFLLLSLLACSNQPARPPVPDTVVASREVQVRALQYVPLDDRWTADVVVAGYAGAQITNRMLEGRIAALESAVLDARVRFRAIRCLEGTVPETPEAKACSDAADAALHAPTGVLP